MVMKPDFIDPFISTTVTVISTMCNIEVQPLKPILKESPESWGTWGEVTGIIGMTSKELSGNMILSFDKDSMLSIVNAMLAETYNTINDEIIDAVGELTNIISGGAKQKFSEIGQNFDMATPLTITGQGVKISQLSRKNIVQIPFLVKNGKFVLEANLYEKEIK